jgi:hypothetical protein
MPPRYQVPPRVTSSDMGDTPPQDNTISLRICMQQLDKTLHDFLQHHQAMKSKPISLEFFDSADWHNTVPHAQPNLLHRFQTICQENTPELPGLTTLYQDLESGTPEALIAVLLLLVAQNEEVLHLHFSASSYLHNFPLFTSLFHSPKISSLTGYSTYPLPTQWTKTYWPPIYKLLAPRLQTLSLRMTWSIASTLSYPPFKTMIPISRLPNLMNLRRLVLPYFAIIPRPKTCVAVLPTSALPESLEELVVEEAYPSRFLLEWLEEVRADRQRLRRLSGFEVRFQDGFVRRSFDRFVVEANRNGGHLAHDPPVAIIPLVRKSVWGGVD